MTSDAFRKIVNSRFDNCNHTLFKKSEEYAREGDRLHNFKSAGRLKGETPEKALWGMLAKHVVSIQDLVNDAEAGRPILIPVLNEKITDWINYALLLEALIRERKGSVQSSEVEHPKKELRDPW